ncbi:hypothetical protein D0Z07_8820 [Hyphodiscus hymeniophilus]|uniref:DUF2231 domain-containing protein n=1 Tax=Hyphodiscus hymeniophilus TaxID=353542 RepID=A0A9P6SPG9_9HELO|nr:hypothetical protein D0Z07_8820 [Hyphodiscus hymeniophilus]
MAGYIEKAYTAIGLGKVGKNSHPVHPATVHFPLALLGLANILNVLYGATVYLPTNLPFTADKENIATLAILGYISNLLGIVTSIPAVLTGSAELYAMIQANGLYVKGEDGTVQEPKALVPKVKTTLTHASLNDIVVFGAVYNWLMERNVPDFKPAGHQVIMSVGALALAFYAAYMGGELVYKHGVGVQRQGEGAEIKKSQMEEFAAKKE